MRESTGDIKNRKGKLFSSESHYLAAAIIAGAGYVLAMNFIFDKSWANSKFSLYLISGVQVFVPAISKLQSDVAIYTNYWGIFFSLFWLTSPVYWLLGFAGASFLSAKRYETYVVNTSIGRVLAIFSLATGGVVFGLVFPITNGMMIVNQVSKSPAILIISWLYMVGVIYYQAQAFRVLLIKFGRKNNRKLEGFMGSQSSSGSQFLGNLSGQGWTGKDGAANAAADGYSTGTDLAPRDIESRIDRATSFTDFAVIEEMVKAIFESYGAGTDSLGNPAKSKPIGNGAVPADGST